MLTRRLVPTAVVAPVLLVAAGCAYLAFNDPNDPNVLMPQCPTKYFTGLDCPFCGGLRMVHAVLHGQWSAAVHANVVLLVGLPLLAVYLLRGILPAMVGRTFARLPARATTWAVVGLLVGWTIIRNVPAFPLHPLT